MLAELRSRRARHLRGGDNAHRYSAGPIDVRLRWSAADAALRISVRDVEPVLPRPRDPGLAAGGGRGPGVVEAVARRWGAYATGEASSGRPGKVVWAELG
ncbi:ATP-binding protein [Streptomyces sp. 4N509B]|uniref:ATP-binding protein n=1 Tax=Streptomyces sp. 4N509B TaxID=3457413 RepID=UPI003FD12458